jgi:hypothetical protein
MKRSNRRKTRALRVEQLQARQLMATDLAGLLQPGNQATYSVDGTGNNLTRIEWGSTDENLVRLARAEYGDGISSLAGADRPSPRLISNTLADQGDADIISDRDLSAFVYVWGQFIDHDIGLSDTGTTESIPITVPTGDPYFDPLATGLKVIRASRSLYDPATGTSTANPRQQINELTSWIDGSMIYGSDPTTAASLRSMEGGKLKMGPDGLLPRNNAANFPNGTVPMAGIGVVPADELFAAGDVRANENIELTALHTLFAREHNRQAERLARLNPNLTDQELYTRARAIVIGEIQAITFNEWLPAVLGQNAIPRYQGYNPRVNPNLINEFSTAAFRFGHSLLGDDVEFLDDNGLPIADEIALKDAFFNPRAMEGKPIESMFKYLASDPASELDNKVVGSVRNFLFGAPGSGGFDLASLNIQRGRDHGLADYNDTRAAIGLPRARSFADITQNRDVQQKLEQLYGSVDKIDLWVGALAEDHVAGASVGPTAQRIIAEQFRRMRDGDRFWYQNNFTGGLLREIDSTRLSTILRRNTPMTNIQENVFFFRAGVEGTVFADGNTNGTRDPREAGLAGFTVELRSEGEVVATALTRADGSYSFNVQSGIRPGEMEIVVTKNRSGQALAQPIVRNFSITRGDQFVRRLDLAVTPVGPQAPVIAATVDQVFADIGVVNRRR